MKIKKEFKTESFKSVLTRDEGSVKRWFKQILIVSLRGMFVKRFSTSNEVIKNSDASPTAVISLANECELAVVNSLQVKARI